MIPRHPLAAIGVVRLDEGIVPAVFGDALGVGATVGATLAGVVGWPAYMLAVAGGAVGFAGAWLGKAWQNIPR